MNLIELAERVEKASGPDRELDARVDRHLAVVHHIVSGFHQ